MSYLAFARKYRPQTFSEVIGQDEAVTALSKAIEEERLHHAYIFSGTRGVGKTTLARIMAKSLNCLSFDKPTFTPCGTCTSCQEIAAGRSVDVIEIDGASNTGVDNIRELRESVKFAPSYARYKVYIIDEVHRISQQAFDALLKTLEEPPSHVKFIFATTELNKVPITILSRCQKFNFNIVAGTNIIKKLKYIAEKEKINVGDDLYRYIAKASLGSIRDAESIFDQIVPMILNGSGFDDILDILGEIKEFTLLDFVETLIKKDAPSALGLIDSVLKQGKDLEKFLDNVIEVLRNIMLTKILKESVSGFIDVPEDITQKIKELASLADAAFLVRSIDALIEVKRISRYLDSMRVPLEVATIRLIYAKPRTATSAQAPQQRPVIKPVAVSKPAVPKQSFSKQTTTQKVVSKPIEPTVVKPQSVSSAESLTLDAVVSVWEMLLSKASKTKMLLASNLSVAKVVSVDKKLIIVGFPKNCTFQKDSSDRPNNKAFLQQELSALLSMDVQVNTMLLDEVIEQEPRRDKAAEYVNDVLNAFDGEII